MPRVKKLINQNKLIITISIVYSCAFAFFTFFYFQKIFAFGCFDDCSNFIGGYFLLKDKQIYTDFFFNHAPMMPILSFFIQKILHPPGVYEFILYHRLTLYVFSYLFGLFLIFRFGKIAFLTLIVFESIKFYVFGDRFLAESYVVYPLIYLFGLALLKITGKKINNWDFMLSAIFSWFIVFSREPFVPLTLFLFFSLLLGKIAKFKIYALIIFGLLTFISLFILPTNDMIQNIYTFNDIITQGEINEKGGYLKILLTSFSYPLYVFIKGEQSVLRIIEIILSASFIILLIKYALNKKFLLISFILITLALANIRFTTPGAMYYSAFHMIIWLALFIFSICFLALDSSLNKKWKYLLISIILIIPFISLLSNESYTHRTTSKIDDLNFEYGNYYTYATAIKNLSSPTNTMFLEERDDSIYIFAGINSSYKYQWYTAHMPLIKKFKDERNLMFIKTPPDFYYDACLLIQRKEKDPSNYTRININGGKSCLLINKTIINKISSEKWESVKGLGFSKP